MRTLRSVSLVKAATVAGATAGIIMMKTLASRTGYVYYIAVLPEFRRKGVAGRMLDDALAHFTSKGETPVFTTVREDNIPSFALFRSRGFAEMTSEEMSSAYGWLGASRMRYEMRAVAGETVLRWDVPKR